MKRESRHGLMVVSHQPGLRLRQFLTLLAFSIGAGVLGFVLGLLQAEFRQSDALQTREVLTSQVEQLRQENTQIKRELLKLERGYSMDQQAISEAQHTIMGLETTVSQLNSDLRFYKNIMAPGEVETNLQVQRLIVKPAGRDDRFSYKLSLTQVGDNRSYIAGLVAVNVIGERDGDQEIIPLRDLSPAVEELGIVFKFRYFQDVEGELTLPDGFKAEAIQIVAQAEGGEAARVERTFEWQKLIGE